MPCWHLPAVVTDRYVEDVSPLCAAKRGGRFYELTIGFIWATRSEDRSAENAQVREPGNRTLFARMVTRNGRHYFEIWQSDGKWHTYPVDYTIGSKFQQAYATKLPNGEIHVFPIQYNLLQKRWINFWKIIDGPGSERADPRSWEKLDSSTSYQAICAVCHTSQLRNVKGGGFALQRSGIQRARNRLRDVSRSLRHSTWSRCAQNQFYAKAPLDPPVNFQRDRES